MSLWLEGEIKKIEEQRKKSVRDPKHFLAFAVVFAVMEIAVFLIGKYAPGYGIFSFFGVVGIVGFAAAVFFYVKSKSTLARAKLPFAAKCLEKLGMSPEELQQFDAEMAKEPLLFLKNGKHFDKSITITEHYFKAAFIYMKEIDYGIFRLCDIAATYSLTSKNPVIIKPRGRIFDILLLDSKGGRMGGVSMESEKDFKELNAALEKYAPNIRLNLSEEEAGALKGK